MSERKVNQDQEYFYKINALIIQRTSTQLASPQSVQNTQVNTR